MADYSQAWEEYRRRRNWFIAAVLFIVPGWFLMIGISSVVRDTRVLSLSWGLLAFAWFAATILTSYRAQYCPCPRCGKQFSSKWWYHRGMALLEGVPIAGC